MSFHISQVSTVPKHNSPFSAFSLALIQRIYGSYGTVDLGATMAIIMMAILPIIIVYLACQKHIIKGVLAGAVKG